MPTPLLHLITSAGWREAIAAGAIAPAPAGFVHLSTTAQVALPATRLFAYRDDVLLLVLDPDRIGVQVRVEEGDPPHPDGLLFPHAYGAVPTTAVTAVLPYRPRPDGSFDAPGPLPATIGERAAIADLSIRLRAADEVAQVTGGVAVRTDSFPQRWSANLLIVTGPADADEVHADADRVLGGWGLPHRAAVLAGERHAGTAAGLAEHGWTVDADVTMAARPTGDHLRGTGPVEEVPAATLTALWTAIRRDRHPDITDEAIAQMLGSHAADAGVVDVRFLAVCVQGEPVASTVLKIDGATAVLGPLDTLLAARRNGHGNALVSAAMNTAARAGCDLVTLDALVEDWPRSWYARRGFVEVGRSWSAHRPA